LRTIVGNLLLRWRVQGGKQRCTLSADDEKARLDVMNPKNLAAPPAWLRRLEWKWRAQLPHSGHHLLSQWLATAANGIETKGKTYLQKASTLFPKLAAGAVLDAGCGEGAVSIAFAQAGAKVVGVDADPDFIDVARMRISERHDIEIEFRLDDLCEPATVPVDTFDLILSIDVVEHVSDSSKYLGALRSQMKAAGVIWLFTPNRVSIRNIMSDPHYRLAAITLMPNAFAAWYTTCLRRRSRKYEVTRLYTRAALKRLAAQNGFTAAFADEVKWREALDRRGWLMWLTRVGLLHRLLFWMYQFRVNTLEVVLGRDGCANDVFAGDNER
jgi:2-polyprenyl-3-methyl-5-hydroxy-6-metoxy-1,4-benzoquinol methylase